MKHKHKSFPRRLWENTRTARLLILTYIVCYIIVYGIVFTFSGGVPITPRFKLYIAIMSVFFEIGIIFDTRGE